MKISDRLNNLVPSASMKMGELAKQLIGEGKEVLNLSIGEPHTRPASHILSSFEKALSSGMTGYTESQGLSVLREEIVNRILLDNGIEYSPDEILIVPGVKQGLYYIFSAYLDVGDEVLTIEPAWVSYQAEVELAGGKLITIPTYAEEKFFPSKEQWEKYITPKTKMIIINSPNNPTGRVYSLEELTIVSDLAEKYNLIVLSDEIYSRIVYDQKFISISSINNMKERTFIANGFSKAYAMPGFRIGYIAAPQRLLYPCLLVNQHIATCSNSFSQVAALIALQGPQQWVNDTVDIYRKNRALFDDAIRSNSLLSWIAPEGTFYGWIDCTKTVSKDGSDISIEMLQKYGIVSVSGLAYGSSYDKYIRISFAVNPEVASKAANVLASISEI